jgi:hypothetical protein
VRHIPQHASDLAVPVDETKLGVFKVLLLGEFLDEDTGSPQVVSGQPGEHVVGDLEVETAVDELDRRRADHVDSGAELARGKGLADAEVSGGTREVGEDNLDKKMSRNGSR